VKNDHVNPSGVTKDGFGNVPFARDEFTADSIQFHVNIDLGQIRGYALAQPAQRLLVLLALHRVRKLLDGDLRLRTACDLQPVKREAIVATRPEKFELPSLSDLEVALPAFIAECKGLMTHETVTFDGELKKGKDDKSSGTADGEEATEDDEGDNGEA
jgi:CRISPR-associated protein Csb1